MQITFTPDDLRPLIEQVVQEMIDRFGDDGRLAYSEAEAAELLGVARHCLRDCRLRGEVKASKVGKGYRYSRENLMQFLKDQETTR